MSYLATYLNDHLAGALSAVEMLEHLSSQYPATAIDRFASELRAEVMADRVELERLMNRLDIKQSAPRKVSGWLAEKLTQVKLRIDDPKGDQLRRLEMFEAISLGVEGKRLLWKSLSAVAPHVKETQEMDLARLIARAEDQRQRVELFRVSAAEMALQ